MDDSANLKQKATLLRTLCLTSTTAAGSGHPTSCLSCADIATVLFDTYFTYDIADPLNITNDRFVLSKGHASPLFYALYAMAGAIPIQELQTLREFGSRLEGHPTPHFPFTDAATGSLGQGLSIGAGMAYIGKQQKTKMKSYVLLGDGELAEGQVWEAANFASHYKLDNVVVIADINRLAQSQETMFGHEMSKYEERFKAFGFETIVIDGHDFSEIDKAFDLAQKNTSGKPFAIIAKTFKGKGVSFLEDEEGLHGKALSKDDLQKALAELGEVDESLRFVLKKPDVILVSEELTHPESLTSVANQNQRDAGQASMTINTNYKLGEEIATREVYGKTLAELGRNDPTIYALDGDVKNSTFSEDFLKVYPERFIECFIAEQNMVGVACGLSRLGMKPFVSTFAAFLTRAADQIRMAALSHATIHFVGSHVGVSIGEDGPSQMGLEDIALFGTLPESVVLQPSDGVSATKLLEKMATQSGISYMRTLRSKTPVMYNNDEEFVIGGSKILRQSEADFLTIVASGITVPEALKAYEMLRQEGINVRIVDCYSIKPIDTVTLKNSLEATMYKTLITVEDHFSHGGLGDFVMEALSGTGATVHKLAVTHLSRSGKKEQLLDDAGIDALHIADTVKKIISSNS